MSLNLYKVILYFETKYAFKRKYEKDLISDEDKLPSFLNENVYLNILITMIIRHHMSNNFINFKGYNLKEGDISPIVQQSSSPLKKMFTNKVPLDELELELEFKEKEEISKRNGMIFTDKRKSFIPKIVNGKTITELRNALDIGRSFIEMKENLDEDNLFSGKSITRLVKDDQLFTIASLEIHSDLFTSCRIFILLDNLFDKLQRIYTDIEGGIEEYNKLDKKIIDSGKDCKEYYKSNPEHCVWFGNLAKMAFTLGKYLEDIHLVLFIYVINTALYKPLDQDHFFYKKISLENQEKFNYKFSKCTKNVLYNSKSKESYMICDTSSKITTVTSPYEKLSTFDGILRLLSITHQMNSALR
jgi:hypothetical protein